MTRIWQIAAGEPGRYYDGLFVNHDVMFLGSGDYGDFGSQRSEYERAVGAERETALRIGMIRAFFEDVQAGDVILMRKGRLVPAIGVAHEEGYRWDETFDDVYGWDLQHTRRVVWQDRLQDELMELQDGRHGGPVFGDRKQTPMFTRVYEKAIVRRLAPLLERLDTRDLRPRPEVPKPLTPEALGEHLFAKGLANRTVDEVLAAIQRQRRLAQWYRKQPSKAYRRTEHEVVAHMVLPLLLALGWSEQLLAVEWQRVDLAAFSGTPTTSDRCVLVCEVKASGHGLQNVLDQAIRYVRSLKLDGCRRILLTEGTRFYLFDRKGESWSSSLTGYVNVEKVRTSNVAPLGSNGIEAILALTPASVLR